VHITAHTKRKIKDIKPVFGKKKERLNSTYTFVLFGAFCFCCKRFQKLFSLRFVLRATTSTPTALFTAMTSGIDHANAAIN
jgi:hypothetical protein